MKALIWFPIALAGTVTIGAVIDAAPASTGWDDGGPHGHASLVEDLSTDHEVAVLRASLALLPKDAGAGDALWVFANRPPVPGEIEAVTAFAARGGHVIMAADGGAANAWTTPFGLGFRGLTLTTAPGAAADCLRASLDPSGRHTICLPSPTAVANMTTAGSPGVQTAYAEQPVFIDLNADGVMDPTDQGPMRPPLVLSWPREAGRVTVVADADAWTNAFVEQHPENLDAAQALISQADTVYFDGHGSGDAAVARAATPWYQAMATVDPLNALTLAGFVLVLAASLLSTTQAPALREHHHDLRPDPTITRAAHHEIARSIAPDARQEGSQPP